MGGDRRTVKGHVDRAGGGGVGRGAPQVKERSSADPLLPPIPQPPIPAPSSKKRKDQPHAFLLNSASRFFFPRQLVLAPRKAWRPRFGLWQSCLQVGLCVFNLEAAGGRAALSQGMRILGSLPLLLSSLYFPTILLFLTSWGHSRGSQGFTL